MCSTLAAGLSFVRTLSPLVIGWPDANRRWTSLVAGLGNRPRLYRPICIGVEFASVNQSTLMLSESWSSSLHALLESCSEAVLTHSLTVRLRRKRLDLPSYRDDHGSGDISSEVLIQLVGLDRQSASESHCLTEGECLWTAVFHPT